MKRDSDQMAARLMEKLKLDSEAPDAGKAEDTAPPGVERDAQDDPVPLAQHTAHTHEEAAKPS